MTKFIKRVKNGNTYKYLNEKNEIIKNINTLNRIKKIYIAPAYTNVKIYLDGDILATGIDSAGRKQYVYSDNMKKKRETKKLKKLIKLSKHIDRLKQQINKDLNNKTWTKNKIIAVILKIMDLCNFRGGNKKYEKKYGSYGLTTLHKKHISIHKSSIEFDFIGKKGVNNKCVISNNKTIQELVKILYNNKTKNNQYLFSINDISEISITDLNSYLNKFDVTTKDLRTWNANIIFLKNFKKIIEELDMKIYAQKTEKQQLLIRKRCIREALILTAEALHNTPAVCKSSYIYKKILENIENNKISLNVFNKNNNIENMLIIFIK